MEANDVIGSPEDVIGPGANDRLVGLDDFIWTDAGETKRIVAGTLWGARLS